jgi:uncharacterized protein
LSASITKEFFVVFKITALYALPLALLCLVLWFRVTQMRAQLKVSIGDAGNPQLHERIEWTPLVLLLMVIAEGNGAGALWLHISGGLLLLGRLVHPFGLKAGNAGHPLRYVGNSASLLATLNTMVCLVMTSFRF